MTPAAAPPRLLVRTLLVTFGMTTVVLLVTFLLVRTSVRDLVRRTVAQNLDLTQAMLAAIEDRRLHELRTQATTLAENPTLKAAVDTYAAEASDAASASRAQLLATIQRELDKLAARVETDAIALTDIDGVPLASAGRLGDQWLPGSGHPRGARVSTGSDEAGIVRIGSTIFRTISIPLTLDDGATVGHLELGGALDAGYARALDRMSRARTAILQGHELIASTLRPDQARDFRSAMAGAVASTGTVTLGGAAHAYREIARIGDARIYALGSIDEASRVALAQVNIVLAGVVVGAFALALLGSVWLARLLTRPIERLSASLAHMATARDLTRLAPDGTSRELDMLTRTFNELMTSVADAESRTEAAYAAAIRALAAALDARDPYTAGHSERVSTLSVAVGRTLGLPEAEIEVLRLGALLHDIGKIGIPDNILRKPGALTNTEFEAIQQHPVVGARILRTIPFLLPHIDIVELHHERPDGRGYPKGLRGDEIPLLARIVHVADAYDAITSARAYRQGRSGGEALRELWRCAGTEYHAEIVGALAEALRGVTSAHDLVHAEVLSA